MTRKSSPLVPHKHTAAKYLSHPIILAMLTWLVVILIGNIMIDEVLAILNHSVGDKIALDIFRKEQTISVILVGLGVLLEGRQLLLNWIFDEQSMAQHQAKNLACEYYGFLIMSVGLLTEIIDQFLVFLISNAELLLLMECLISFPLNLYALYLLIMIGIKLMMPTNLKQQ